MTRGTNIYVPATLPAGWWHDEGFRENVYREIRGHLAEGMSLRKTAKAVGVSDQTVKRFVRRVP